MKTTLGQFDIDGSLSDLLAKGEAFRKPYLEIVGSTVMRDVKNGCLVSVVREIASNASEGLSDAQCRSKLAKIEGMTLMLLQVFGLDAMPVISTDVPADYAGDDTKEGETHAAPSRA